MPIILMLQDGNMTEIVDIADLDCVFLSYKEPNADENWAYLRSIAPWAKRVHGVEGSDAAHKAAAAASNTERFILIDGDNRPDAEFFNQQLRIDHTNEDCVFRWRARNIINGLCYGNGGISSWTRDFIKNMQTHETSDGTDQTVVEFCFDRRYWAMHDVWSTTYPNASAAQAWQAGFREGVKLCLDQGKRLSPEDFESAWIGNRRNLNVWLNIGADVENGWHAIYGARQGVYMAMFDDDWDYTQVRDFAKLETIYAQNDFSPEECQRLGQVLSNRLDLNIYDFPAEASAWIKQAWPAYQNVDIMLPETEYSRIIRDTAQQLWR
jgi:hypothetical protein